MQKKHTVVFLCGLIGSGKSSYAVSHFRNITDIDDMHQYATKQQQISWTKQLLGINPCVCHITCYPTPQELGAFNEYQKRFLLITTSIEQCKTNILIRNRPRDMDNIPKVFKANQQYLKKFKKTQLQFERISIFPQ